MFRFNISDAEFTKIWNEAASPQEVATKLGVAKQQVATHASRLRKRKEPLKSMRKGNKTDKAAEVEEVEASTDRVLSPNYAVDLHQRIMKWPITSALQFLFDFEVELAKLCGGMDWLAGRRYFPAALKLYRKKIDPAKAAMSFYDQSICGWKDQFVDEFMEAFQQFKPPKSSDGAMAVAIAAFEERQLTAYLAAKRFHRR